MAKTFLCSVFDAKASSFAFPFVSVSKNVAVRNFGTAVNDPSSLLNQYPADFSLYCIGEFDDACGLITPITPPEVISMATSHLRPKGENDV